MNLLRKINSRLDIISVWIYKNLRYLQKFQVRFNILTLEVIKKQFKSLVRAKKGQINRWKHAKSRSWQKRQIWNEMNNI